MAAFTALSLPQLHPTVTHYDAGKSNVRTYLFRDYTLNWRRRTVSGPPTQALG